MAVRIAALIEADSSAEIAAAAVRMAI